MKSRVSILVSLFLFAFGAELLQAAELEETSCYECHDELQASFSQGSPHPPVAEGDCEACHEDHGEEERLVLADEVPELCFGCHDEFPEPHLHDPASEGECLTCHNPHHSKERSLLTQEVPALCHDCHDDSGEEESVHPPVADGECMECHDAHQSPREALLTAPFDGGLRVRFSEDAFALCFNCHDADVFQKPVVDDETGFRQGNRNLHYVHLIGDATSNRYGIEHKRKKRMSCAGCHLPHASGQPRLVRPNRKRGTVTVYTINYQEAGQGGSCVVGCHKPRQYRRDGGNAPASGARAGSASNL